MATAKRPYRSLKAGSENYKLILTTNAIVEFEEHWEHGDSILVFGQRMYEGNFGVKELRLLLWAALTEYHEGVTEKGAGTIMDRTGFQKAFDTVAGAFEDAFPEAESAGENGQGESPKPVEALAGETSSQKGSEQD